MSVPEALTAPAQQVDARLRVALEGFRRDWTRVDPMLGETIDLLERLLLAGGKRIRPAMAYWGFVAAGGAPDDPRIADLGAGLELLQAFALFHDDVMDGSLTRRGMPTAHVREVERHTSAGWRGEARRYGEAVAILAGDVALVMSDVLLSDIGPGVRSLWNELRIEVNLGQFLDVVGTARGEVGLETAERIVDYKTARYTIVRPLQMGSALAGGEHLIGTLAEVGTPLGMAFQLRDDLLGAFGEPDLTGKPVGDDLREGKPTPLLARARALATPDQVEVLALVGSDVDDQAVRRIQATLTATGAVEEIEHQIAHLTETRLERLRESSLSGNAAQQLSIIARYLAARRH